MNENSRDDYTENMSAETMKREGMLRHFSNEAKHLSALNHPYIVKVHQIANQTPITHPLISTSKQLCHFIVMEYAERGNLFDYICQSPLSERTACFYFRQLLDALFYMHY